MYFMPTLRTPESKADIYPGRYVPLFTEYEVKRELDQSSLQIPALPPVNIVELIDSYRIELAIPGIEREELVAEASENILSISVLHKKTAAGEPGLFKVHEFEYSCFDKEIVLPENVDTEFVSAEYHGGVLSMHVPKAKRKSGSFHSTIVVY